VRIKTSQVKTVLVTGAKGMLGTSVCNKFKLGGYNLIPISRQELDLRNSKRTFEFFSKQKIDLVIHCAALVGGIQANMVGGAKFFLDNIEIDHSVISASFKLKVKNLIYIGSSCMYPANLNHAIKETEILSGNLEPSNENYALAKIFGSRTVSAIADEYGLNWRVFISSNLYGPNDHFDSSKSHLLAAVIKKSIVAKEQKSKSIEMWGDGSPKREFTHIEDFSDWIYSSAERLKILPNILNVGIGKDYSVLEIYKKVLTRLDLDLPIVPNNLMPNGNYRKLMDSSIARSFGWDPKISLDQGISSTIKWYTNTIRS
jgi:GDP-L-fucose synthase